MTRETWTQLHGPAVAMQTHTPVQALAASAAAVSDDAVTAALGPVRFVDWRTADARVLAANDLGLAHPDAVDAMGTLISAQDLQRTATAAAAARNPGLAHGEKTVALCRCVLARSRLEARCPWGGEPLATDRCVVFPGVPWGNPVYAYRFDGAQPFYLLVSGFDRCRVLGLFLPWSQTAIEFDGPSSGPGGFGAQVAALRSFLLRHADRVAARFAQPAGSAHPALLLHSTHFAHGLWNEVAAVEPLLDALPPGARLHVRGEPNGPIHEIFPEIPAAAIVRYRAPDLEEFYLQALEAGAFPAPLGRLFIPRSVACRVVDSARAACAEDAAFARSVRAAHDVVLWITIRHGARTCLNQRAVLAALVDAVAERHPSLAVVIDGFTPGHGHRAPAEALEAERAIARGIVADVAAPCTFVSLVGATLRQAFVWGGIVDAYAANHGSIQHKIAWLHDAPGVAHAPRVQGFDPSRMVALAAREGCAPPPYVFGVPATRRAPGPEDTRRDLDDYEVDPEALKAAVLAVLPRRGADRPPRPPPAAKVLHEIDDVYFAHPAADRMIARGSEAWGQARWHDALDHFTAAVKLLPDDPKTVGRLLTFLLNAYRMRLRRKVDSRSQFLGLLLAQELEPNNAWARQQALEAVLDVEDQAQALRLLRTWLAFRPGLADEQLRPLVRPEQAERFKRLWSRHGRDAPAHPGT